MASAVGRQRWFASNLTSVRMRAAYRSVVFGLGYLYPFPTVVRVAESLFGVGTRWWNVRGGFRAKAQVHSLYRVAGSLAAK
jgi:hypothetical protein